MSRTTLSTLDTRTISRRDALLLGVGVAAGAVTLAACGSSGTPAAAPGKASSSTTAKGSVKEPMPKPASFQEAPSLTAAVKSGSLPALTERLPENPYVLPHRWVQPGKYGGIMRMSVNDTTQGSIYQFCMGHAFLRIVNDGLDVYPGLAESWEVNDDATRYVFHFRKGLRWSDGKLWTTADIMYWWEDMVVNKTHPDGYPDDVRSGKDTVAEVTAPDDYTLVLAFDAPAPAVLDRIGAWVNGSTNGTRWMAPKHYAKQFHPKYNKAIDPTGDWPTKHDDKLRWAQNPACPTMTGWHTTSYGSAAVAWERNPYYYCVTADGDQLPYIDRVQWIATVDPQVQKLQFVSGKVDYVQGSHTGLGLGDVSSLKQAEAKGKVKLELWDSGSGTGSMTFFNFDTRDAALADLLAQRKFRQALSMAFNRAEARKTIYFEQGELTSGTLGPKGQMFQLDQAGKTLYTQWRDAFDAFDPEQAKKMLDDVGLKDTNGDGFREFADGTPLTIRLDLASGSSSEHTQKCNLLQRDWEAVGIHTKVNPVAPTTFTAQWARGELMTQNAWEIGGAELLLYAGWVVPVVSDHYAPLTGQGYNLKFYSPDVYAAQVKKAPADRKPPFLVPADGRPLSKIWQQLQQTFDEARATTDPLKRLALLQSIAKVHVDQGPFYYGVVANYPSIVLHHPDLANVPTRENLALGGYVNPWYFATPAVYDPECFSWTEPSTHST